MIELIVVGSKPTYTVFSTFEQAKLIFDLLVESIGSSNLLWLVESRVYQCHWDGTTVHDYRVK